MVSSAIVVVAVFFIFCAAVALLQRCRRARSGRARFNASGRRSSNLRKPWNAPAADSLPTYYQTTLSPPPPVHTPQYPPRGYETHHGYSQSQGVPPSPRQPIPQPTSPRSPVSTHAPSTSRPISSVGPTPLSVRSSMHRSEPATLAPLNTSSSSSLSSPRSAHRNVVESPLHPPHTSPPPSAAVPSSPSVHPPAAVSPPRNQPSRSPLAPMSTGASYAIDDPPPAYTPI